jgi:TniQ
MVSFLRLGSTFAAVPGESLLSWLSRLCVANDMSTEEFCSHIIGRDSREFAVLATRDEHALALGCVTGVGEAAIRIMMHAGVDPALTTFFDQPIPWWALERSKRRVAPSLLVKGKEPFLRALWSIRVISCDPTSGQRLVDRCTCGQPLWWRSMHRLLECNACGRNLGTIAAALGNDEQLEVSRFWASIYSLKHQKRMEARSMLDPEIRNCDAAKLLKFTEFLGELDKPAHRSRIETGTLVLKRLGQTIDHLSEIQRRAVEQAILDITSFQ